MQTYYENWKKTEDARKKLRARVLDPEGLLTGNGHVSGVYEFLFVNQRRDMEFSAYIGQAGNDVTAPAYVARDVYQRCLQHLKRWMGGSSFTYWCGLEDSDESDWKIKLHLLAEERNHGRRLALEEKMIADRKPFLQDSKGGKYALYPTKYGYSRNDLCLAPWGGQRRAAFLDRVEELGI
jgi:hypothetical protein